MSAPVWASKLAARLTEKRAKSKHVSAFTVEVRASASVFLVFDRRRITPNRVRDAVCTAFLEAVDVYPASTIDEVNVMEIHR